MKEGRIRGGLLIISAHLIRITGRDHGGLAPECRLQPHAENLPKIPKQVPGMTRKGKFKERLFFMTRRGPSWAPPHMRSLLTGGCFALRNLNVRSIQEIKRKDEIWEPTMGKTGLFSWVNRRLYS